jgi:hypothetical protein
VSLLIDGQPTLARGYEEASERIADAPAVQLARTDSIWIAGFIGDTRQRGSGTATNDVDLYRIDLPTGDHYALALRTLAQRIGSPLDPAVSLFDSAGQFLASNDDAMHDGALSDSEVFAGVNGGTYYIAVSAGGNLPGEPGGFDPLVAGSGTGSHGSTGQYLLQVTSVPDSTRPEVVRTSIEPGTTLHSPLTQITVQFSESMNVLGLMQGAKLLGPDGVSIVLSATDYDPQAFEVTYALRDRPADGDYVFSLSAADVTDHADNPISGDALDGGYALHFALQAPDLNRQDTEPNGSADTAQDLGPLYPSELRPFPGVKIAGSVEGAGDQDFYRFQVTRMGLFTFRLRAGPGTNQTGLLILRDANSRFLGQGFRFPGMGSTLFRPLKPGEYLIQMDTPAGVPAGSYTLTIQAANEIDVPLVDTYAGPSVNVVLSTHDGERPPEAHEAPTATIVITTDAMAYSISSMPTVGSQPVGRPQLPAAGKVELAWVDTSSERQVLPAGVVFKQSDEPVTRYSVASVSGSFLDPLPEAVFGGTNTSDSARQLAAEFRAAIHAAWDSDASQPAASTQLADHKVGDNPYSLFGKDNHDVSEDTSEATQGARTPSGLAFGMAASLSAVGAATSSNRRRPTSWIQHAFEWIGIDG